MKKNLCKGILFLPLLLLVSALSAQNVGINISGANPSANAILDLNTGNNYNLGLLIPRVVLGSSLTTFNPPMANAPSGLDSGMMVYNWQATNQPIGYYCWNGSSWVSVTGALAWQLTGNSGTTPGTDFLGTTDNNALILKTFSAEGLRITSSGVSGTPGNVGIGNIVPQQNLSVNNGENIDQAGTNNGFFNNGSTTGNSVSFGSGSGEGIASNRNSSAGYELNGLQFYTDFLLAINIANMGNTYPGQVSIINGLNVDQAGDNNGFLDNGSTTGNGITFGTLYAGEGIASKRTAGGNQNGLDFYTDYSNRIAITNGGNVGIGTTAPNKKLEIAGNNTERIDGLVTGNTFNSSATTSASNLMYTNNTTGDVYALPTVNNAQLVTSATGVPFWQSPIGGGSYVKDSAWLLTGNAGTTPGTNFIGTTDAEALEFKVDAQLAGWIDYTNTDNTFYGFQAGGAPISGFFNTAIGYQALNKNVGNRSTAIGTQALSSNTTGNNNAATGYNALFSNTTGNNNTANGSSALFFNTTGTNNTAAGDSALFNNHTGQDNTATGANALQANVNGPDNTADGFQALYSNSGGQNNTATGATALYSNTLGSQNTAIGYLAMYSNTTGEFNTATGDVALQANTTGEFNTATGFGALSSNIMGEFNTATGVDALTNNAGQNNTATGVNALFTNTTGKNNTATGVSALFTNATGNNNTAIGDSTLFNNTASNITGLGFKALFKNTSGTGNQAEGYQALYNNTTGSLNIAIGTNAFYSNTVVNGNLAIGDSALYTQSFGTAYNSGNLAIGNSALFATQPTAIILVNPVFTGNGNRNTAVGEWALRYNTQGYDNEAIGNGALYSNTTGYANTANGKYALFYNTTGILNAATGTNSLYYNTNGSYNTSDGADALFDNTTGNNNTAVGLETLSINTNGNNNTASGAWALSTNTTGNGNTASGYNTLAYSNTGSDNTGSGYNALYYNVGGNSNTATGSFALYNNVSGSSNTAVGDSALYSTTNSKNSALGYQATVSAGFSGSTAIGYQATAGESNAVILGNLNDEVGVGTTTPNTLMQVGNGGASGKLSVDTKDNDFGQIQIGNPTSNAEASIGFISGVTAFGDAATSTNGTSNLWIIGAGTFGIGGNNFGISNSAYGGNIITVTSGGEVGIGTTGPDQTLSVNGGADKPGGGTWGAFSDIRLKQQIKPYTGGLEQILCINPVTFHYNKLSGYDTTPQYVGVIAQQLKPIAPYMVSSFKKNGTDYYQVDNSAMTYMLINGMKEQQKLIEAQKSDIDELKQEVETLKQQVAALAGNNSTQTATAKKFP